MNLAGMNLAGSGRLKIAPALPMLAIEPTDPMEQMEPTLPILAILPTEAIEAMLPALVTEAIEPALSADVPPLQEKSGLVFTSPLSFRVRRGHHRPCRVAGSVRGLASSALAM